MMFLAGSRMSPAGSRISPAVCRISVVLLAALCLSAATQYGVVTGRHPSSPLMEVTTPSRIQCGLRCQLHASCASWWFTAPQCSLYRGVTSDPSATTTTGSLYADLWIPEGYQMVPGAVRAFRAHNEREIEKGRVIPEECAKDHPKAAPAFIENGEQLEFAKSLITEVVWTGIHEGSDFTNTRTVDLKPEWIAPEPHSCDNNLPCVRLYPEGLDCNVCGNKHGYLCEYELLG